MSLSQSIERIGVLNTDDAELKLQKNFLVYLAIFMSIGGLIWGGISLVYSLKIPAIFPLGYVVISFYNIAAYAYHKNFKIARTVQILASLLLPFLFQWSLGGFGSSGAIMLWALLALIASLTFKNSNEGFTWLVLFIVFTLVSAFFEELAISFKPEILPDLSLGFLVTNVTIISAIVFGLVLFFVGQQRKDREQLNEVLIRSQKQETQLRESSERQLEDAEKLYMTQRDLEKKQQELENNNKKLQESERELRVITQRQMEANLRLTEAQEELQKQEMQFRAVVENSPEIILSTDASGIIQLCEGTELSKFGLRSKELIGTSIYEFFDQNDEENTICIDQSLKGVFKSSKTKIKDLILLSSYTPLRDRSGKVSGLLSIAKDVTEEQLAKEQVEAALQKAKESESKMRQIAEEQLMVSEKLMMAEKDLQDALQKERSSSSMLKETQSQLVNNEKMASLGQLTAGIAHEINNPINFVYNGIDTLKITMDEMFTIINKLREINDTSNMEDFEELIELKKDLEIDELAEDIDALVSDIKKGAVRTIEIVKGLRVFSRLDEEEQKSANINENLDATLVLLKNKTKDNVEIKKLYDDTLGEIDCFPGQLNQVFMNILSNAIQAFPEDQKEKKIWIYTESLEKSVNIRIKDNGMGIPEDVKKRIFEPFFTTKPVGVGTGLGLSISYGIIEKHNGEIYVESEQGKGTEFVITLPK